MLVWGHAANFPIVADRAAPSVGRQDHAVVVRRFVENTVIVSGEKAPIDDVDGIVAGVA